MKTYLRKSAYKPFVVALFVVMYGVNKVRNVAT